MIKKRKENPPSSSSSSLTSTITRNHYLPKNANNPDTFFSLKPDTNGLPVLFPFHQNIFRMYSSTMLLDEEEEEEEEDKEEEAGGPSRKIPLPPSFVGPSRKIPLPPSLVTENALEMIMSSLYADFSDFQRYVNTASTINRIEALYEILQAIRYLGLEALWSPYLMLHCDPPQAEELLDDFRGVCCLVEEYSFQSDILVHWKSWLEQIFWGAYTKEDSKLSTSKTTALQELLYTNVEWLQDKCPGLYRLIAKFQSGTPFLQEKARMVQVVETANTIQRLLRKCDDDQTNILEDVSMTPLMRDGYILECVRKCVQTIRDLKCSEHIVAIHALHRPADVDGEEFGKRRYGFFMEYCNSVISAMEGKTLVQSLLQLQRPDDMRWAPGNRFPLEELVILTDHVIYDNTWMMMDVHKLMQEDGRVFHQTNKRPPQAYEYPPERLFLEEKTKSQSTDFSLQPLFFPEECQRYRPHGPYWDYKPTLSWRKVIAWASAWKETRDIDEFEHELVDFQCDAAYTENLVARLDRYIGDEHPDITVPVGDVLFPNPNVWRRQETVFNLHGHEGDNDLDDWLGPWTVPLVLDENPFGENSHWEFSVHIRERAIVHDDDSSSDDDEEEFEEYLEMRLERTDVGEWYPWSVWGDFKMEWSNAEATTHHGCLFGPNGEDGWRFEITKDELDWSDRRIFSDNITISFQLSILDTTENRERWL